MDFTAHFSLLPTLQFADVSAKNTHQKHLFSKMSLHKKTAFPWKPKYLKLFFPLLL